MKTMIKYECERCGTKYATPSEAISCEAFEIDQVAAPGDIVLVGYAEYEHRFGWFNGDKRWIESSIEGASISDRLFSFYFVVGAVTFGRAPRSSIKESCQESGAIYHCFTRAIFGKDVQTDDKGCNVIVKSGWTRSPGHYPVRRVEPQPNLPGAQDFVGQTAEHLL